jgi:polar amino acid transport system substrate-binding protein
MQPIARSALIVTMICAAHTALAQQQPSTSSHTRAARPGQTGGAIYTAEQARQGHDVYMQHCASCHGDKLQGLAAPALAGNDFLSTAQHNGWTIGMLQTIVTQNMPFNDPASLSDGQYADVIAYLLASNCYPAGTRKFPEQATAAISNIKISTPEHPSGSTSGNGTCLPS